MNKILIVFTIIVFYSCKETQTHKNQINTSEQKTTVPAFDPFGAIQDFKEHQPEFVTDTFDLFDHSTDGGQLIVFRSKTSDYMVWDFWLYGETGRLNYTYWTEKSRRIKFNLVRQCKYEYDKPYYMEGFKTDSVIRYLSYSPQKTKLFDAAQTEITDPEQIKKTQLELETFFKTVTKDIEIVK